MKDPGNGKSQSINFEDIVDFHVLTSVDTPLRKDAFKLDDELKIELIEKNFKDIMPITQTKYAGLLFEAFHSSELIMWEWVTITRI